MLEYVPLPVLYGVFIYMGLSSLKGNQFFDRIMLLFMTPKNQPDYVYLRHVPLRKAKFKISTERPLYRKVSRAEKITTIFFLGILENQIFVKTRNFCRKLQYYPII